MNNLILLNKKEYYNIMNEHLTNKIYKINQEYEKKIEKIHHKILGIKEEYNREIENLNKEIVQSIFEDFIKNSEKEKYFLIKYKKFECIKINYYLEENNNFSINNQEDSEKEEQIKHYQLEIICKDTNNKLLKLYGFFEENNNKNNRNNIKFTKTDCYYESLHLKDYETKKIMEMMYYSLNKDSFLTMLY